MILALPHYAYPAPEPRGIGRYILRLQRSPVSAGSASHLAYRRKSTASGTPAVQTKSEGQAQALSNSHQG